MQLTNHLIQSHDYVKCHHDSSCTRVFADVPTLERHAQVYHSDLSKKVSIGPIPCRKSACKETFENEVAHSTHLINKHGFVPCKVESCKSVFSNIGNLDRHHKHVHSQDAPIFYCDVPGCNHTSIYSDNMMRHKRVQHNEPQSDCYFKCTAVTRPTTWYKGN